LITAPLLSLLPDGLAVDLVEVSSGLVTVHARSSGLIACCPLCATPSRQVHGRYTRPVADLPLMGRIVSLSLQIRRFRCSQSGCPRRIFAERLPAAAPFRKRRTVRLAEVQRSLALGAGGELGSRLASLLAMPVSGATLLRLIRAVPVEPPPAARIIGIDDWAWRRGHRYGTIIVDLENENRLIDLLRDRKAETVEAWLKAHPGIEIVARDRAGSYADGVRAGVPEAVQVADRWHLLRNLGDTLSGILDRYHRPIRAAAKTATAITSPLMTVPVAPSAPRPPTRSEQRKLDRQAARQARFEEVAALHARGWSQSAISRSTVAWTAPRSEPGCRRASRLPGANRLTAVRSTFMPITCVGAGARAAPTRSGCGKKSTTVAIPAGQRACRNGSGTSSGEAIRCPPGRRRRQAPGKRPPAVGQRG
jgi:hypothetical protein